MGRLGLFIIIAVFGSAEPAAAAAAGLFQADTPPETELRINGTSFSFSSPDPDARFECRLDSLEGEGTYEPCVSPHVFPPTPPGTYTVVVRAVNANGTPDPTPASGQIVVPATARFHENVVVAPVTGTIKVRPKGSEKFEPLTGHLELDLGSDVDVTKGKVELASQPAPGAAEETVHFSAGRFKVTQRGHVTNLRLTGRLARCGDGEASSAKRRRSRRLWGEGVGRFRTSGRYSSATVSGTKWLVKDGCRGTLTRVEEGVVRVRDKVRDKTVIVEAGEHYLARARH